MTTTLEDFASIRLSFGRILTRQDVDDTQATSQALQFNASKVSAMLAVRRSLITMFQRVVTAQAEADARRHHSRWFMTEAGWRSPLANSRREHHLLQDRHKIFFSSLELQV